MHSKVAMKVNNKSSRCMLARNRLQPIYGDIGGMADGNHDLTLSPSNTWEWHVLAAVSLRMIAKIENLLVSTS